MKISETDIIGKTRKRLSTRYIDTGDFGKLMYVDFTSIQNDGANVIDWCGVVYCAHLPTKMSSKLSEVYDAYTKAMVENNYTKTITSVMGSEHVSVLFILLEEYIRERLFTDTNIITIKASRVCFLDDKNASDDWTTIYQ